MGKVGVLEGDLVPKIFGLGVEIPRQPSKPHSIQCLSKKFFATTWRKPFSPRPFSGKGI